MERLVTHLRHILPDVLQDTPVTLAYLYGSQAEGKTLPTRDIDIALVLCRVEGSPAMPSAERLQLEFAVEGALEQHHIINPDVRVIDDMPLTFRGQVATRGTRLYARDETARVEFETRTWKEYIDFEPVARMMRQAFFDDVRRRGLLSKKK